MKRNVGAVGRKLAALTVLAAAISSTGCLRMAGGPFLQTTMGGQTLPSAYFLDDDVQYFPKGPETKLSNQIRAIEQYNVERAAYEVEAP